MLNEIVPQARPEVKVGEFPFKLTKGATESRYLTWLRNHSNYMAVRGTLDYFRMVAVLVRGILVNFLVLIPYLMGIAVVLSLIYGTLLADWHAQIYSEALESPEIQARRHELHAKKQRAEMERKAREAKEAKARKSKGQPAGKEKKLEEKKPADNLESLDNVELPIQFFLLRPAKDPGWVKWMQDEFGVSPPFVFTPVVLTLTAAWILVFPVLMLLCRIAGYRRSLETGSDSSVKSRDMFERSFGFCLLVIVSVALFEALPLLVHFYHQITDDGAKTAWPETLAASVAALFGLSFSDNVLKVLGGVWKKIAVVLIALLGLVAPLLFVVFIMDILVYVPIKINLDSPMATELQLWDLLFAPIFLLPVGYAIGILFAMFLGACKRAFSFLEYARLFGLLILTTVFHLFLILLLIGVWAILTQIPDEYLPLVFRGDDWAIFIIVAWACEIWFFCWLTVDVNLTSIHALYRDRLASAYLMGRDSKGEVDIEQDIPLEDICCHELGSTAPYHLINVALNLQGSKDISLRDRQSDFFVFSKKFIGGLRTGYCRSETMRQVFPQIDLASAMANSAAAASPNMGRGTSGLLVAFMTLLNIRLGVWVPNPGLLEEKLAGHRFNFDEVFLEELKEVQKRWQQVYPNGAERRLVPVPRPTPEHGLVGIGFSGGGIRSATVNLGIAQALHHAGIFDHVDYLSTVSGGGYLGSSISALMRYRTSPVSEIAGAATVADAPDTGGKIVTVTGTRIVKRQDADGIYREGCDQRVYRYGKNIDVVVKTGDRVEAGQRLIRRIGPGIDSDIAGTVSVEVVPDTMEQIVRITGTNDAVRTHRYSQYSRLNVKTGDVIRAGHKLIQRQDSFGDRFRWQVPPRALVREMTMSLNEHYPWVNVSDGGHIENLAAIELLRRRCKLIIIGDGECDPHHYFNGLATLIRTARLDLGVHFEGNVDDLRLNENRCCRSHWAIGRIIYPDDDVPGYILYLKSSFTGDEDEVIGEYRNNNKDFPHQTTADQFFDEGQFEAYRALGQHIGECALAALKAQRANGSISYTELNQCFEALWHAEEARAGAHKRILPATAEVAGPQP